MDHLSQFVDLWGLINNFQLDEDEDDDITWKLTSNGQYTTKSAYEVQFLGSTLSCLHKSVWKNWAPPKTIFFIWLLYQNRVGPPTGWRRGGGRIAAYVLFASVARSPWTTFSFIAGSL
jgi:hypothetical protein